MSIFFWWVNDKDEDVGHYEGALFADYFADKGIERARSAGSVNSAEKILAGTYKGPDCDGIGVMWSIS